MVNRMFKSVVNIRHENTGKSIYWPKFAKKRTQENVVKKMSELMSSGDKILVKDSVCMGGDFPGLTITISFK